MYVLEIETLLGSNPLISQTNPLQTVTATKNSHGEKPVFLDLTNFLFFSFAAFSNSKIQIVTKLKISDCDKTQFMTKLNLWQNFKRVY